MDYTHLTSLYRKICNNSNTTLTCIYKFSSFNLTFVSDNYALYQQAKKPISF